MCIIFIIVHIVQAKQHVKVHWGTWGNKISGLTFGLEWNFNVTTFSIL